MQDIDPVTLDVWWNRFTSIVDEMAAAVERTAYSSTVREANDYCCALLDTRGQLISQNTRTIPSFIGTVANTVREVLRVFPIETLNQDDVMVTNHPWVASGHLPDITVVLPIFYKGKAIGFSSVVLHLPDIGGRGGGRADTTSFYEEGLLIPIVKLYSKGIVDQVVVSFISNNVRIPREVMGDIEAAVTAVKAGEGRVIDFLKEYSLEDIDLFANSIQNISERAMREAIKKLPAGTYTNTIVFDGWDNPLTINLSILIKGDELKVDYAGTSLQISYGINSVYNYTYAYTIYAIKCVICPFVPNNEGSCRPITVTVPEGTILNPKFPAAVSARFLTAHFIQPAVFGAFAKIVPEKVSADSSAPFWGLLVHGQLENGEFYVGRGFVGNGGQGANISSDGISCLCIPSNVGNTPIEYTETTTSLMVREKELIPDSAGPGKFRGGLAQKVTLESVSSFPTRVYLLTERLKYPAKGYAGAKDGAVGQIFENDVPITRPKGEVVLQKGDKITVFLPGGGGYGDPVLRDKNKIKSDLLNGYVTLEKAKSDYSFSP